MAANIFAQLQTVYRKTLKQNLLVRESVFACKTALRYLLGRYCPYRRPSWSAERGTKPPKLAVICDEFTWQCLRSCRDVVYLTPSNWRRVLENERPDALFCEAAWSGQGGCWENEILRSREFRQDNRRVLKAILRYCHGAKIPTVFWNKEDTPAFDADPMHFIETAMLFDHIFTTAEECIPKYQALGHGSVHLMMFGFLPEHFYPAAGEPEENSAVFLGSWYANHPQRCQDMHDAFQMVLSHGLELKIFDRFSGTNDPQRQYPPEYRKYLHPAVPYAQTGDIMRRAKYVININTVTDSRTMFARRVFEAMACGKIVISNESAGLRQLFADRVWFIGEPFDVSRAKAFTVKNLEIVNAHYTFDQQLTAALQSAGLSE